MKIDKQAVLDGIARCIDVANAQEHAGEGLPDYHLLCGGGETVATCTWFLMLGFAGTDAGEMLRKKVAEKQATSPHFSHRTTDHLDIRESSDREIPR
jgi:hypothetical protein